MIATLRSAASLAGLGLLLACSAAEAQHAVTLPLPAHDVPATVGPQVAVFAGGCFWTQQAVFEHVKGVLATTAGYDGGSAGTASYDQVSSETTRQAESLRITYDPRQVTYGQLLRVFFSIAHDPTQL
ncbi:MAG: peptide-methionine (S)-S-oxide reductase, partial [Janthinobacterium lividum]